jgi:hypothetical protein
VLLIIYILRISSSTTGRRKVMRNLYYGIGMLGELGLLLIGMFLINIYGDYGQLIIIAMILWGIIVNVIYCNARRTQ